MLVKLQSATLIQALKMFPAKEKKSNVMTTTNVPKILAIKSLDANTLTKYLKNAHTNVNWISTVLNGQSKTNSHLLATLQNATNPDPLALQLKMIATQAAKISLNSAN